MKEQISRMAGSALIWKGVQHGGIKIIFFIRLLILARLLSPDDFGLLAVSMVAVGIMASITDFGMIPALVQRSITDETHYHAAWTVGMIRAVTIAVAVILLAPFVAQLFNEPRATEIIQVLAILPLLEAAASIKLAELIRNLRFRSLAFVKLPEALVNTIVAVSLASSLGVWALVAGNLAGPIAVLILSYVLAPYGPRFSLNREATRSLIRFGRWIFLNGIIVVLSISLLRLVITRQLGTVELGLYFLGAKLAFLPAEIASQVVGDVSFSLYSRLQANLQKVTRAFQSLLIGTLVLLVPICVFLITLAPILVEYVLGSKWEGTVPVIRILAFVSIFSLIGESIAPILKGLGQPYKVLVNKSVQFFVLISLLWFLTKHWGLSGAALAWLPAVAISQIINSKYVLDLLPHPFSGLGKPFLVIVGVSVAGAIFALGITEMIPSLMGLILAICLTTAGTGLALWFWDRQLRLGFANDLARAFPQVATFVGYNRPDR